MRKIVTLFIVISSFVLTACSSDKASEVTNVQKFFEGTVLSVDTDVLLVEPAESTAEQDSSNQIEIELFGIEDENSLLYLEQAEKGDKIKIGYLGDIKESYPARISNVVQISLIESAEDISADKVPMVMIEGKLYCDVGKESEIDARCGVMDGEITLTVDESEIPTKDNQSNFGKGYGYQRTAEDTIEIYRNEKWCIFEAISENEKNDN